MTDTKLKHGAKPSKKNRKHGRGRRSPAMAAYNIEQRWIKNQIRRVKSAFKRSKGRDLQAKRWLKQRGVIV